jgi:hypothetical protein
MACLTLYRKCTYLLPDLGEQGRSRKPRAETVSRADGGLDQDTQKWSDAGHVLK